MEPIKKPSRFQALEISQGRLCIIEIAVGNIPKEWLGLGHWESSSKMRTSSSSSSRGSCVKIWIRIRNQKSLDTLSTFNPWYIVGKPQNETPRFFLWSFGRWLAQGLQARSVQQSWSQLLPQQDRAVRYDNLHGHYFSLAHVALDLAIFPMYFLGHEHEAYTESNAPSLLVTSQDEVGFSTTTSSWMPEM